MNLYKLKRFIKIFRAHWALTFSKSYSFNHTLSIVVVTHNRLKFLKKCIDEIRKSTVNDYELIIWNNASDDGTKEWLDSVKDDWNLKVTHSEKNVGCNAYARSFRLATGQYLVEIDDDVWEIPSGWDTQMLEVFKSESRLAYLGADANDGMAHQFTYTPKDYGELTVLYDGPISGWFAMAPRKQYDILGGFPEVPDDIYFFEAGMFQSKIRRDSRFKCGLLPSVIVKHGVSLYEDDLNMIKRKLKVWEARNWSGHKKAIEDLRRVIKEREATK